MDNEDKKVLAVIFLILLVGLSFFYFSNPKVKTQVDMSVNTATATVLASIVNLQQDLQFAGYDWDVTSEGKLRECNQAGCSGAGGTFGKSEEGFIILTSHASSGFNKPRVDALVCMTTKEDIRDIDEFLVIWEGLTSGYNSGGTSLQISILDKQSGVRKIVDSKSGDIETELVKVLNNFDGTYSAFYSLGVGDVFIKDKTIDVSNFQSRHLQICLLSGASGLQEASSTEGNLKIFNIITKRLESPICKADELLLPNGSCSDLDSILLSREEAIFESVAEKIARIEERLEARELLLEEKLEGVELSESKILELEKELQLTNQILQSIQSGELTPPPDVDIEEIISGILNRIESEEILTGEELTDEQINSLIQSEVNSQFEDRFPAGLQPITPPPSKFPITPILIGIVAVALLFIIFKKR